MRLVDANVLLYAVNGDDHRHDTCRRWLDDALSGGETTGFAWVVLLAFLRLATRVGVFPNPMPTPDALALVEAWLDQPSAAIVEPTARHLGLLAGLLAADGSGGNLVTDAHLAALALEHDATVVTFDRDFHRFQGIRVEVPASDH